MTNTRIESMSRAERRRLIIRGLFRALAATTVLVAIYFLAPLDRIDRMPPVLTLTVSLVILLCVSAWQVFAIIRSAHPAVRAIEALAITAPLFLLLFAATYFLLAQNDPGSFNTGLTRTDALYFTVTVFATVGFGDIVATSEMARRVVTLQMILDLLIVGLGIRVFVSAVQRSRRDDRPDQDTTTDRT